MPTKPLKSAGPPSKHWAEQIVAANGVEIDGVSGATYTTDGCIAAVQNALDPDAYPFETAETESAEWPTGDEPVEIPADRKIVSATTYGMYTKDPTSDQDAVIRATLYWDLDNDECYAIRFAEPLTPFMDTGATSGWACVQDEATLEALGDNVIHLSIPATEYGEAVETDYAKYIQIGDIVWTGEAGSTPGSEVAVVYTAEINGEPVTLFDYCATEEGGEWYVETTEDVSNLASTYSHEIGYGILAIVVVVLGYFIVKRVVKKRKAAQAGQQNPKA